MSMMMMIATITMAKCVNIGKWVCNDDWSCCANEPTHIHTDKISEAYLFLDCFVCLCSFYLLFVSFFFKRLHVPFRYILLIIPEENKSLFLKTKAKLTVIYIASNMFHLPVSISFQSVIKLLLTRKLSS